MNASGGRARGVVVLSVRVRWLLASGEAPGGKWLKGWAIVVAVDINSSWKEKYDEQEVLGVLYSSQLRRKTKRETNLSASFPMAIIYTPGGP